MSLWAWDRPWRLGGQDSHEAPDSWSLVGSLDSALAIPERLRSRSHRRVVNSISGVWTLLTGIKLKLFEEGADVDIQYTPLNVYKTKIQ